MKRIIILTGSELRHKFFCQYIASDDGIKVINSYCEVKKEEPYNDSKNDCNNRLNHFLTRTVSEKDFFQLFVETVEDCSNSIYLNKGEINNTMYIRKIVASKPDLLIAYGCSIIKEPLLSLFSGRFINVHLGLSPYYRGSGTNYWPLVNNEPEYIGATFMYIDSGIDTGEVIHQIRAKCFWGDGPSQIGNRLILDMSKVYKDIINNFDSLKKMPQLPVPLNERFYKRRDYTEDSVLILYKNFYKNLIGKYLIERNDRCKKVPIIKNNTLERTV
jgi:phosphoribosylglycinamide formyltransferase 1